MKFIPKAPQQLVNPTSYSECEASIIIYRSQEGVWFTQLPFDFIDQMEIHPTEMSRGVNGHQEVIERLTSKIREGAHRAESLSSACICRVPQELRKLNESTYTPQRIAIGPLHRNDPHLQTPMQHVKMSYMKSLLCRMTQRMENREAGQKKILQDCVAAMEMSIDDAKKCYAEEVTLDAEMMLVDGCFILELLYKFYLRRIGYRQGADPIFANDSTYIIVQHDLVLLENQIPFLVLERLFPLTVVRIPNNPLENLSLTDYVFLGHIEYLMRPLEGQSPNSTGSAKTSCWPRDCILWVLDKKMNNSKPQEKVPSEDSTNSGSAKTSCWPRDCIRWVSGNRMNDSKPQEEVSSRKPEEEVSSRNGNYHHILHKIHDLFLPHDQTGKGDLRQYMPSASELLYAGVKFESCTGNDLFKVKFTEPGGPFWWCRSARFKIRSISIQDWTEPLLRNFIAFEQCCPDISQHFTSYATLMDMLVTSDKDVQVLEKAGVVDNWLGASEDVTNLFNKLCKEAFIGDDFLFGDACNRATMYSKRFWPKNMAYLRRQYFASPWKFIAFCLGFVYFGLTIAQLIVSIKIK